MHRMQNSAHPVQVLKDCFEDGARLFICADPHGCLALLMYMLKAHGFNFEKDVLVVAGDIIDRGASSEEMVDLLMQRWFYTVRGNHEDFLIKGRNNPFYRVLHQRNGGQWFYDLPHEKQTLIAQKLDQLPYAIEIHYKGLILGVVHADVMRNDWNAFKESLTHHNSLLKNTNAAKTHATLSRSKFKGRQKSVPILNVDAVFFGHNVTLKPFRAFNTFYIDTGACFFSKLTILNIDEIHHIIRDHSPMN